MSASRGEERGAGWGERENSKFWGCRSSKDAVRRIYAIRPLDGRRSRCVNWARPNRPVNGASLFALMFPSFSPRVCSVNWKIEMWGTKPRGLL
jgi:hypothetical protein